MSYAGLPVEANLRGRLLFAFLCVVAATASAASRAGDSSNLKMGNPSQAKVEPNHKNNLLLDSEFFALSYNNDNGTPNWVSWRLAHEDLGTAPRKNFHRDERLLDGITKIGPGDYKNTGFDRGHMCPHSDRAKSDQSSLATFAMTNMVPQSHDVNTKAWNQFELYLRDLVTDKKKVCYVIAGPAGKGGIGKNGFQVKTPNGKLLVPSSTWKVVMVLDEDVSTAKELKADSSIRLIAVVMPNADGAVGDDWESFRTTVKEVEALTNLKFFGEVESDIIDPLKDQEDDEVIQPPVPVIRGRR